MIISILLIILSIAVGVGTWLYLKKKDNSSMLDIHRTKGNEKVKPNIISTVDMTKEKLAIDDISNNIITLENYKKRTILLKIKNSDFNMLSEDGQNVTEDILRQLALSLQYDIGFYSTTRAIDTEKPLAQPKKILNLTENPYVQRYAMNYINTLNSIMTSERIAEREDYIILTYIGDMKLSIKELERRASQVISILKKINTKCELVDTEHLIDLIYHDLNRNEFFNPSNAIKLGALDLCVGHTRER